MGRDSKNEKDGSEIDIVDLEPLPEGGWGWFVCLAGFIAQFVILGIQNNTGILYTTLLTEFKGNKGDTAWVLSIGLGMMFLFCPITSALCERVGCRIVAVVGGVLGILGFLLSSFVKDLYVLYVTFGVLWGIGSSMSYLPTLRTLPYWFRRRISLANGIVTAGSGFGTIAMGPIMQVSVTYLGWAHSTRIIAGVLLVCTVSALLYRVPQQTPIEMKIAEEEGRKAKKPFFDFSVLSNKAFLVWCVSLGIFMMGYFVPFVHLPAYAIECGIPMSQSSTLVGMMSIGSTFGRLFFGKICDHPRVNRLYVFQVAFLFIGIAHTLSTLTKSYAGFVAYMIVFGIFDGCFVVLLGVLCADIVGMNKVAAGMGVQFFFMAITCTAGPPLAGIIYDLSSSYQIAFYAAGACATLACCLLFLVPVLMPRDELDVHVAEEVRMRSGTDSSEDTEMDSLRSPIMSPDSSFQCKKDLTDAPTHVLLRSGAQRPVTNSNRNSYVDRYFDIPKRASCSSFFGPSGPYYGMAINNNSEYLMVVERMTQV